MEVSFLQYRPTDKHLLTVLSLDIHLSNVLLRLPSDIDQLSDEQLYEKYGRPSMEPVVRFDGRELPPGIPTHGIVPVWFGEPSNKVKLSEAKILLIDFGQAFAPSQEAKYGLGHLKLVSSQQRHCPSPPTSGH